MEGELGNIKNMLGDINRTIKNGLCLYKKTRRLY